MSSPNGVSIREVGEREIMIAARQTEYLVRESCFLIFGSEV